MTSRFADDEAAKPDGKSEQEQAAAQAEAQAAEIAAASLEPAGEPAAEPADDARWQEPAVAAQRILTDVFRSGGKTASELEDLLHRSSVDPRGFIDYWARANFLKEVVRGRERRFELSKRAVLELELDVA